MIFKDMFIEEVASKFKFQIIKSYCSCDGGNILNTLMLMSISSVVKKGGWVRLDHCDMHPYERRPASASPVFIHLGVQ